VAFTYHKNVEMAEVLVREVEASSAEDRKALAFGVSVLDVAGTDRVVREIQGAWGGIDVLVNNAAITQNLPLPLLEDGVGRNLPDHRRADYLRHCSLGRVGTFAEVAEMAAFLVSDRSSYMTGETVVMDGGV
jgi:NAD(P)-dependent dehydrogenase (short-subunit alcohol dehydrogenase family)